MRKFVSPALISTIIGLVIHFSALNNYFINLSYDTLTNLRSSSEKASGVVIIGIDDASLSKYDKTNMGIIPREIYTELLNKLKKWAPKAAAFDIIFDIKTGNEQHDSFIEAIENFGGRIILSSYFQRTPDHSSENYITPYEQSGLKNASWGYVNVFRGIFEDDDLIRRRFRPFERIENKIVYSLPLALAESAYSVEISNTFDRVNMFDRENKNIKMSLPLSSGYSYISYSGNIDGFHVLTLDDVISATGVQAEIFEKLVRNKIVLIGSISPRHRDI
ncbi:MAG TPA: CHASE2 domain-containing protein, partial [Candidatus Wallbacteria bacterium]|nr:CHASE2 domain-containing protein [Candidatus Wallbacteria bacterium]